MKKTILFTISLLLTTLLSFSQDYQEPKIKSEFWQNVSFGGGIGLNINQNVVSMGISPSAIYRFNDKFALGTGLNANYSSQKDAFKTTILGGNIIGIFKPDRSFQLALEFEENYVIQKFENLKTNYWTPALFIGGGFNIGNFGAVGVRYNLLYDKNKSIYGQALLPFVRVYF